MSKKKPDAKASKKKGVDFAKLRAATEKAERKAAKKAGKKKGPIDFAALQAEALQAEAKADPEGARARAVALDATAKQPISDAGKAIAAAEKVLDDPNAAEAAKVKARAIKADVLGGMTDEDLRARVVAKRAAREALEAERDEVDRDDEQAVAAYNARLIELGGGHLLTSNAERDRRTAEVWAAPEQVAEVHNARVAEAKKAKAEPRPPLDEAIAEKSAARKPAAHVAEVVATEEGDVIAVGPARDESIALPSEAPKVLEENGNRQYKIARPEDGRVVGYTRATTYIDNLEDKSALEKWKLRLVLEGAAVAESDLDEHALVEVRDLIHRRDVTIAKARKRDRKGKAMPGELGRIIEGAWSDYKKGVGLIAERLLEVGGAHEKREKGTDLHALCELADAEGINAVAHLVETGGATESDLADVRAYLEACEAAGLKMLEAETVVVIDELKVAGRLDRIAMYRKAGAARGTKVVADIKTGRVDYSAGKIAQQIRLYAIGQRYDLETHERTPLGVSKTLGLLIHLPAGMATCTIYEVDLTLGAKGVELSGKVRAWRNEGKRAFDLKAPVADVSLAPEDAS